MTVKTLVSDVLKLSDDHVLPWILLMILLGAVMGAIAPTAVCGVLTALFVVCLLALVVRPLGNADAPEFKENANARFRLTFGYALFVSGMWAAHEAALRWTN